LILVGPTASGKSALAVELAGKFAGEVISADSRQVYKGLDIGTGKITKREMRGIRHHLLDVASPKKIFTAHDFLIHTHHAIAEVVCREKLPILCGGTGFYIDAVVGLVALPDVPANAKLRAQLEKMSAERLFKMLEERDARRAKDIDPHNKRRLIRALEISAALGASPRPSKKELYDTFWIGIAPEKDDLRERIQKRLSARLRDGMIAEARTLHRGGLSYKRMDELGLEYRSLARFLQRKISRSELEAELAREIPHYAKRQMTYWKRNANIHWFRADQKTPIPQLVWKWLEK